MLCRSFEERRSGSDAVDRAATFEESYPRYEFAELVRLAVAVAAWLVKVRRRLERRRDASTGPLPDPMNPAE